MSPRGAKRILLAALLAVLTGAVQSGTGNGLVCVSATCFEAPVGLGALLAWSHRLATIALALGALAALVSRRSVGAAAVCLLVLALALIGLAAEATLLAPVLVAAHVFLSLGLTATLAYFAFSGGSEDQPPGLVTSQAPLVAGAMVYMAAFAGTVGWRSASACELWPLCENPDADPLLASLQAGSALGVVALALAFALPIWRHSKGLGFATKVLPRLVAFSAIAELMIVVSEQMQGVVIGRLLLAHAVMAASAWLFIRLGWLVSDRPATSALPTSAPRPARELRT